MSAGDVRRRYGLAPDATVRRSRAVADGTVRLTPDSFTVVELRSALDGSARDRPVVVAGSTARLTVWGTFVGEGSPLAATLRDARNRTTGRGDGPVHRDRAVVAVEVGRQTAARESDGVLCAADLRVTGLGLAAVSPSLLVLPFAELVDARWATDRAVEGETVGLSCRAEGPPAGVERLAREPVEVDVLVRTAGGAAPFAEPDGPRVSVGTPVHD